MDKSRTELLIGKEGSEKLGKANIAIVGVGGVGGYVCHMLARSGIEKLTIVDFDKVRFQTHPLDETKRQPVEMLKIK